MRNAYYLRVLQQHPQASNKELARLFSTTPEYVNVILQRLKDKRLITISHRNGRRIKLTRRGERLLEESSVDKLTLHLNRLITQLRELNKNLRELRKHKPVK